MALSCPLSGKALRALRKLEFVTLTDGEDVSPLIAMSSSLEELSIRECEKNAEACFKDLLLSSPPGVLCSLTSMDLSHNAITSLPAPLFATCLPALQALILSYNQLSSLPESLGQLRSLHMLLVSHNQLSSFPQSVANLPLSRLDLSHNNTAALLAAEQHTGDNLPASATPDVHLRANNYSQCCALLRRLSPQRAALENSAIAVIQRMVRRHQISHKFHRLVELAKAHRSSADLLSLYKKDLSRRAAAITIQSCYRSYVVRRRWRETVGVLTAGSRESTTAPTKKRDSRRSAERGERHRSSSSSSSRKSKKKSHARHDSLRVPLVQAPKHGEVELQTRYPHYPFTEPDSKANLLFSKEECDESGKPLVRAGTRLKLVELLCTPGYSEGGYLQDFLLSYTDFMSTDCMLELLVWLFHVPPPKDASEEEMLEFKMKKQVPAQMACLRALSVWVENFFADFCNDSRAAKRLRRFMHDTLATSKYRVSAAEIGRLIKVNSANSDESGFGLDDLELLSGAPKQLLPTKWMEKLSPHEYRTHIPFREIPKVEVARQLTLLDSRIFRSIARSECFGQAWNKKAKNMYSPNLTAMIERFNRGAVWVTYAVVSVPDLEERIKVLRRFVLIANELYELRNFHSLMMVITGLGSSSVSRLKATWEELDKKTHEIFMKLQNLMSIMSNFKNYRAEIAKVNPSEACIPLIALFLSDLTFLDDGNPDEVAVELEDGYVVTIGRSAYGKRAIASCLQKFVVFYVALLSSAIFACSLGVWTLIESFGACVVSSSSASSTHASFLDRRSL